MDKGIYTALSGGIAKSHEIELVANNLANANTPGFKRDTGTFNEYLTAVRRNDTVEGLGREIQNTVMLDARPQTDKSFVELDGVYTDFTQGSHQKTGRSLDFALSGAGFFEVLTPAGVQYTRAGNFSVNAEGVLVSSSGHPILGAAPAGVEVPPEARVIRLLQGPVHATSDGTLVQNQTNVAQLAITEFSDRQWLEKVGGSYWRNTDEKNVASPSPKSELHQGFLEGSNVNAVREMTRLIEATRSYESHMQAIRTYQEIDNRTVNDIVK